MSRPDQNLTFYPAYCCPASPTYFVWVKLTCHDIHHHLSTRSGNNQHQSSTGNPLYFYLNHPIQFVQVTGIVVAIEDYHPHIFLFTLDDSSGATIDVVWRKPKEQPQDVRGTLLGDTNTNATAKVKQTQAENSDDNALLPLLTTLTPGSIVLAKGTLSPFRGALQLNLLRLSILTPIQELRLVSSRTSFLLSTLSKPWSISASAQTKLLKKATGERDEENNRAVRARKRRELKEKRERKHEKRIAAEYQQEDRERAREAEKARQDGVEAMKRVERLRGKR